jgi:hypothetical protein
MVIATYTEPMYVVSNSKMQQAIFYLFFFVQQMNPFSLLWHSMYRRNMIY